MVKRLVKNIDKETKQCKEVFEGTNTQWAISEGFEERDVEQAYDEKWYLIEYVPEKPAPTYEEIRQQRQERFMTEADPIRYDYDEALARGKETAEVLKQEWLAKKDEIRADLPYPDEESYSG